MQVNSIEVPACHSWKTVPGSPLFSASYLRHSATALHHNGGGGGVYAKVTTDVTLEHQILTGKFRKMANKRFV